MFLLDNGLLPRAKWSFNRIHYEVKSFSIPYLLEGKSHSQIKLAI